MELSDPADSIKVEVVPSAGAILNAVKIRDGQQWMDLVEGYSSKAAFTQTVHKGFWSAKLSPFVCRLKDSTYSWEGKTYQVNKFELNGSAIHGLLYDAVFDIVETAVHDNWCSVALRYQYDGKLNGYPFPYNMTVIYRLEPDGKLKIHTHLSNPAASGHPIPICDGWHPYFRLGGKVDNWWLQIASSRMLEYSDQLIPTGGYTDVLDFLDGDTIGERKLDNGFLLREGQSPICVLHNDRYCVEFLLHHNYPYLQVYIPDHRESIAIENLSAAPDAFNNGMGLTALEAGHKWDGETVLRFRLIP